MPDVILMDIVMPGCDGLAATRVIKALQPNIKVVMLTMSETDADLFSAIKSGASGYLLKTGDTDKFFKLLEGLMRGEVPLSPGLPNGCWENLPKEQMQPDPSNWGKKQASP